MFEFTQHLRYPGRELPLDDFVSEYRRLYQVGIDLFAEFNPCEIHDGHCYDGRNGGTDFCCSKCEHVTDAGCTAEALYCKLWICSALRSKSPLPREFTEQLNVIVKEAGIICRGMGGRRDLSEYIVMYYGKKGYRKWRVSETRSNSISLQQES